MAPHIPLEVITEILAKLPVKSLSKFRVVCKSWCSLISTKQFVTKHLSSSDSSNPKRIIQLSTDISDADFLTFYSVQDSKLVQESSPIKFQIENPNYNQYSGALSSFYIMGYCDGLVCVKAYTSYNSHIFLWNPSTRDSKLLPYRPGVANNSARIFCCWGFGYDYSSDDYKVLMVFPPEDHEDSSRKSMLYTLRTNSWRSIQDFPLDTSCRVAGDWSATLVNGALHWMARQGSNGSWSIISLDLTTETYMEVPQPDFCATCVESNGIGVSSTGCLCLNVNNSVA
uniref:F-box/kelch-repeat protein At3g23880-like n=1 Tax=Fragaria vesca subsp. vesca TaxID=101020 RepID=UPI0005C966EC|nr:PREDICTED: F-box/kelch-repeat protein At3g23880-like [Fragaria vesca subsp. vesca]